MHGSSGRLQVTPPSLAVIALAAAALSTVPVTVAHAQTVPPAPTPSPSQPVVTVGPRAVSIPLGEAVARAAAQPPAVRAAMAQVLGAQGQVTLARAGYYPVFTAQGDASIGYSNRPYLPSSFAGTGGSIPGLSTRLESSSITVDAQAAGRMTLWDFGRTPHAVAAAEHGVTSARESLSSTVRQAVLAAATGYLAVLGDRELIASVQATLHQREAHLAISTGLVSAGARPPIEQVRAQVDMESSQLDLTNAQSTELTDRAALAAALGLDPVEEIDVVPVADDALAVNDDPRRAADLAVSSRPEFAAARARLQQAESQLAGAHDARNPTLSANVLGTVSYNEVLTSNGLPGLSEALSGGLTLGVPLFDYSIGANIAIADANVVAARENLEAQSLAVRTDAVQSSLAVRAAQASLNQAQRLAYEAAQNLGLSEGRYRGGAAPLLELVDAQAADEAARIQVVRARFSLQVARVRLMAAIGGLEVLTRLR